MHFVCSGLSERHWIYTKLDICPTQSYGMFDKLNTCMLDLVWQPLQRMLHLRIHSQVWRQRVSKRHGFMWQLLNCSQTGYTFDVHPFLFFQTRHICFISREKKIKFTGTQWLTGNVLHRSSIREVLFWGSLVYYCMFALGTLSPLRWNGDLSRCISCLRPWDRHQKTPTALFATKPVQ